MNCCGACVTPTLVALVVSFFFWSFLVKSTDPIRLFSIKMASVFDWLVSAGAIGWFFDRNFGVGRSTATAGGGLFKVNSSGIILGNFISGWLSIVLSPSITITFSFCVLTDADVRNLGLTSGSDIFSTGRGVQWTSVTWLNNSLSFSKNMPQYEHWWIQAVFIFTPSIIGLVNIWQIPQYSLACSWSACLSSSNTLYHGLVQIGHGNGFFPEWTRSQWSRNSVLLRARIKCWSFVNRYLFYFFQGQIFQLYCINLCKYWRFISTIFGQNGVI